MESAKTMAARCLAHNRTVDVGRSISRGIDLVTGNLGLVVGSSVLAFVVMLGVNLFRSLAGSRRSSSTRPYAYEDLFGDQPAAAVSTI